MFIHGGLKADDSEECFSDWNIFDFGLAAWININVMECQGEDKSKPFDIARNYHSLTSVVDKAVHHKYINTR